jgi:hypothetical protein
VPVAELGVESSALLGVHLTPKLLSPGLSEFLRIKKTLDSDTWFAGQKIGLSEELDKVTGRLERAERPCQGAGGEKERGCRRPGRVRTGLPKH